MIEELEMITEAWNKAKMELEVVMRDVEVLPDGSVPVPANTFHAMRNLQAQIKRLELRITSLKSLDEKSDYMLWPPRPEPRKVKPPIKPTQSTPRKVKRHG